MTDMCICWFPPLPLGLTKCGKVGEEKGWALSPLRGKTSWGIFKAPIWKQQGIYIFSSRIMSIFHVATLFGAFIKRFLWDISSHRMLFLLKMKAVLNSFCKEEARYASGKEHGVTGCWNVKEWGCRKTGWGSGRKGARLCGEAGSQFS